MNACSRLLSLSIALASTPILLGASDATKSGASITAPVPVSFTAAPTHFPVDGKEHHPTLAVRPTDATYKIDGVFTAKKPGVYTFTATATGNYSGSMTCRWQIDPPRHLPKKQPKPAPTNPSDSAK